MSKREDLLELRKKGKLMYGQVPLLEIDGGKHCLVQSGAILRYVAESSDLVPKNALERYYAQAIVDGVNDMRGCVISYPFHLDMERAKKEILSKVDRYFQTWESMLAEKEKKPDTAASSSKSAEDVSPFFFERCSVADAVRTCVSLGVIRRDPLVRVVCLFFSFLRLSSSARRSDGSIIVRIRVSDSPRRRLTFRSFSLALRHHAGCLRGP